MEITRRSALKGGLAIAATSAFAGRTVVNAQPARAASAVGDVVGKISVGYQGWFACRNDGSPIDAWWHWATSSESPPSPTNIGINSWPDMREYTATYKTDFKSAPDGRPAALFSSFDQQTIDTHFSWMKDNGCDTVALQRFNPTGGEGPTRDKITEKVRIAAESHGRKFYIMYDVSGWTAMQSQLKTDWTEKMSAYTSSSAYAMQGGKPVVCIWGFGLNDNNHDFTAAQCLDVVQWFRAQGCYVIGGVSGDWRAGARPGFADVYHAMNMISPWMVGRIGKIADVDGSLQVERSADKADCDAHGVDYQPCVLPGDLFDRQRVHGDLMWRQFYNLTKLGVAGIYISMFDEYNENNQIAKTVETSAAIPSDFGGRHALDEDGVACSADYYLRLTADGGRMLKKQIALTPVRPTAPVVGGALYPVTTVVIKSSANGRYVSAHTQQNADGALTYAPLVADSASVGDAQTFDTIDLGDGTHAIRARSCDRYVSADPGGSTSVVADRFVLGAWERFRLQKNSDGSTSLRAVSNDLWVTVGDGGASSLVANRSAVGPRERFVLAAV
jgi:hypothetical protein